MKYSFVHVKNKEILDKIHRFRYRVYEEMGWMDASPDGKDGIETDIYDNYCNQFAILNANGEICCTMRLIYNSPVGYPTEEYLAPNQIPQQLDRSKLAEMSRIFIDPRYRNMRETRIFIISIVKSLAYEKIKEHGIEYCYGLLEPSFIKLVNIFKIPYEPICDLKQVYNKLKYPSILSVKDLEKLNPQLEKYWETHKKVSVFHLDTKLKPEQIII